MKTELATVEELSGLTLDELGQMANTFGEKCQQAAKKTVQDAIAAGTALLAAKEKCSYGQWMKWLGANWDYDGRTARTYMAMASNWKRFQFDNAGSIREAMGMIAAESAEADSDAEVPRESRKPGRVKVSPVGQQPVRDDHVVDVNEMVDDDPAPDPPTIRKTAAGSQKVKEADKPKTRPVVAEVLPEAENDPIEDWLAGVSVDQLFQKWLDVGAPGDDMKKAAKQLRKLADKLDPPDESKVKIPAAGELCGVLPDSLSDDAKQAVIDWAKYKQRHSKKEWRYQTIDSWRKDVKRMENAIMKRGENRVIEMLTQAESTGWRHWDHDTEQDNPFTNGKGNGNGHKTSSTDDFIARNSAKLKATFGCD